MKGRKFIDSTVPSCHGRVQSIPAGGPTTLRSNFRNKHQSCASQSCTLFGFPQQKQPLVRSQRQNIAAFSQVTRFYHTTLPGDKRMPSMQLANVDQRRVVSWSLRAYSTCSQAIYDMIVWSRISIRKPAVLDRNDRGWASGVITLVLSVFNTSPTWDKHTTSSSKNRPASMYVVAKIKMSSANRRSKRVGPPSPKSSLSLPTVRRHIPIAISNTAQNSRGLPCLTPRLMSNNVLLSLVPAICPLWSLSKLRKSQIIWSLIPCWDKARQSDGQCTRSRAFDKSTLTIQIGMFTLQDLSITKFIVTKCSSMRRPDRNPCFLQAEQLPDKAPHEVESYKQTFCTEGGCLQWAGTQQKPSHGHVLATYWK